MNVEWLSRAQVDKIGTAVVARGIAHALQLVSTKIFAKHNSDPRQLITKDKPSELTIFYVLTVSYVMTFILTFCYICIYRSLQNQ